jgi:hypothetical protein
LGNAVLDIIPFPSFRIPRQQICCHIIFFVLQESTQRSALAAGRTGKTPLQTRTTASKPAPYPQGEALSAARIVGHGLEDSTICRRNTSRHDKRFFEIQARRP